MVSSPCKDTKDSCNLNENNRCTTCHRTVEDIINWANMDEEKRIERMEELYKKFED